MNNTLSISTPSLLIVSLLVLVSLFFSYTQKLDLEKDTIIAVIRAVVQLYLVGYVLTYVFDSQNIFITAAIVLFMILNAAYNAANRGKGIKDAFIISFVAIFVASTVTLSVLVLSGALKFQASQVVPVSGMIISNAMVAIGISYRQLLTFFKDRRQEVETKLALGADILSSSIDLIRDAIKTGMQPTIDSAKTLGVVSLPGMMSGLILAGIPPVEAIKYQIMVTFMLLSTTAIGSFIACYLAYRGFFNKRKQLIY